MKLHFNRKMQGIYDFKYILTDNNNKIITEIIRNKYEGENKNKYSPYMYESTNLEKKLKINFFKKFTDTTTKNNFQITKSAEIQVDKEKTYVYYCIQKGINLFKNEYYWQIDYLGKSYKCYEIGLGKKGTYYCIYNNNETVAILKKNPITKENETKYDCYSYEDFPIEILTSFNIYFDLNKYYPSKNIYSNKTLHSWQKWLLNKYDENFIKKIEEEEN